MKHIVYAVLIAIPFIIGGVYLKMRIDIYVMKTAIQEAVGAP